MDFKDGFYEVNTKSSGDFLPNLIELNFDNSKKHITGRAQHENSPYSIDGFYNLLPNQEIRITLQILKMPTRIPVSLIGTYTETSLKLKIDLSKIDPIFNLYIVNKKITEEELNSVELFGKKQFRDVLI